MLSHFLKIQRANKGFLIIMSFKIMISFLFAALFCFSNANGLKAAEKLTAGVATNFMIPFQEIARAFEEKTGITVVATYTSTGNLYHQIKNGAPFDIFLSADKKRVDLLVKDGIGEQSFIYAKGKVVIWSKIRNLNDNQPWNRVLLQKDIRKIALANPETAPYGSAALYALKDANLWDVLQQKMVFAQNVAQVFQYAHTSSVDVGFCALSYVYTRRGKMGKYILMDNAPVIIQTACIIKKRPNKDMAHRFKLFLLGPESINIKKRYGYE